ncbi:MAG TPA: NFACT RNA binding domain-containing protein [Candidatus Kapabacteria bacterium]|nr:NFACT RNA binding domain-containing protein [Candidatus Kapabacteria bacterium]
MHKNYFTLAALAAEFSSRLQSTRFLEAYSHQPDELVLSFLPATANAEPVNIRFITNVQRGCMFIAPYSNPPKRNVAHFFSSLQGSIIRSVDISTGDRIVYIRCDTGEPKAIALAMFGKTGGNALLLNVDMLIEESFKSPKQLVGTAFVDSNPSWQTLVEDKDHLRQTLHAYTGTIKAALSKAVPVLGSELADDILFRAGIDSKLDASTISDEQLIALVTKLHDVAEECENKKHPQVVFAPKKIFFALIKMQHVGAVKTITCESVSDGVRRWFAESAKQGHVVDESEHIFATLDRAIERTERAIAGVTEDLNRDDAGDLRRMGDLLSAHAHEVISGSSVVTLESIEILLDKKLNAIRNAALYFEKAKKRKAAVMQSQERLEKLRARLAQFKKMKTELANAETPLERKKLLEMSPKVFDAAEQADPATPPKYPYRYFQLNDDCEVFVGKNAKQNDELTFRFAKQSDLWFHARGVEGSHTVLRWSRRTDPPKECILRAAAIAAFYSKAKNSKYVPVAYTQRKYVHKPRGTKPGSVAIAREEVVMVEPKIPENTSEDI